MKDEERNLWKRYQRTRDDRLRNELVERYLPSVSYQAQRKAERTPVTVTFEDLYSAGVGGLMEAVRRFDMSRGVTFKTYCVGRIRGAMLDYLRAIDPIPRLTRAKANKIQQLQRDLTTKLERAPTDDEMAAAYGIPIEEFDAIMLKTKNARVGLTDRRTLERDDLLLPLALVEDDGQETPLSKAASLDLFGAAMRCLAVRNRCAMTMYYIEDLTFKEIGWALGVSESRACQIVARAGDILRNRFKVPA